MQALQRIRPYLRDIGNQPITNQLATGELCVAVTPAADVRLARDLARETGQATDLQLMVPKEGAILWMDVLAIPADAPHPEEAHALIDFLMRPEVIAAITRETYVANANRDATALVPASIRDDPSVYPTAETLSRMHLNAALSADTLRWLNREFAKVRTGE
jgi:putrescine transport system substrate-binding protein